MRSKGYPVRTAAALAVVFSLLVPGGARAASGDINTIAGGAAGDGLPAVQGNLPGPSGLAYDATTGTLYVADRLANRIRKVAADGTISTVAGTGAVGFFGDGGPAAVASLNAPNSLCLDPDGNIYIADTGNNRIRKIDTAGVISTIAGAGAKAYGGDGGQARQAFLGAPAGVSFDVRTREIYIADTYNNRIRKIATTGIITTVAGNGSGGYYGDTMDAREASLFFPTGVVVDALGQLYIADQLNHRVRKVDAQGKMSTYAGSIAGGRIEGLNLPLGDGLPAQAARLYFPTSLLLVGKDLYITDVWDHRVRKVDEAGFISTVSGTGEQGFAGDDGPATAAAMNFPEGVALGRAGELYVSDTDNHRVRRISPTGVIKTVAGNGSTTYYGDGGPASGSSLYYPASVASAADGTLYIADAWNQRIRAILPDGTMTTVAGNGEFGADGDGGPALNASFNYPNDVSLDGAGNLFIADTLNNKIRRIDHATGIITTVAGEGTGGYNGDDVPATEAWLKQPFGVAVDPAGNIFIADTANNRIRRVDATTGWISTVAGRSGGPGYNGDEIDATTALLAKPYDVVLDADGNIYIADSTSSCVGPTGASVQCGRVRRIDPATGEISTFAGGQPPGSFADGVAPTKARLSRPYSLLVNGDSLLIADAGAEKIYRVASSAITRIAGGGFGFGDGGPATSAGLHGPSGLSYGPDGTLYIADALAHRIRAIVP